MTGHAARCLIVTIAEISAVRILPPEPTINLLKDFFPSLLLLYATITYDNDRKLDLKDFGEMDAKMAPLKDANVEFYDRLVAAIEAFKMPWRKDRALMLLIGVICLLSNDNEQLANCAGVR